MGVYVVLRVVTRQVREEIVRTWRPMAWDMEAQACMWSWGP